MKINRRQFVRNLGLGTASLSMGSLISTSSCAPSGDSRDKRGKVSDDDQFLFIGDDIAIAQTEYGKVQGYLLNHVYTFLGVPYGADTSGKNRFMPPQKPEPWTDVRPAVFYGNTAPQRMENRWPNNYGTFADHWNYWDVSEDCLYLNVWTPGIADGKKRPVLVWLHGGGFTNGSGIEQDGYHGENISREGDIVFCSINHRLGPIGFSDLSGVGGEAYKDSGADFIVALGGGSPMDVAKAVGVTAKYGGSITEYEGAHKVPGKIVPLIAIPTTAGTGSEVTAFSVITDHSRDYKLTVFSYELLPAYAILDPELLTSAPASVAAACGIDAFIHAEEAYVSTAASPFSDAMAEKAMELIGGNIRRFVARRTDLEAAEAMLTGSLFAGIAFSFARLGNVHAMSHPVSAFFNVAHGVANAVLLPVIAEYNALADHGRYLKIYNYISPILAYEDEFEPLMLVDAIRELNEDIGIPEDLTTAIRQAKKGEEISDEEIESKIDPMADDAMKSGNIAVNPRSSRKQDIVELYHKAL